MIYDDSRNERWHRAIQAESAPPVLISKRCACGKAAPAKQLVQHQKCVACLLADRVATLHDGDLKKLQHALGVMEGRPKSKWGFRNYYCASRGGQAEAAMRRLVDGGFMHAGHESETQAYFHATKAGCKLSGLDAAGARRALEDS